MRAWLAAIMRNLHRSGKAYKPAVVDLTALDQYPDPGLDPEEQAGQKRENAMLRQHIANLPEALRETLLLREFAGLSYAEIARTQNVPVGTVMSRLARARASLRESINP
jgi:RNA polymerase sigma-70 factor (ECF subfamily)